MRLRTVALLVTLALGLLLAPLAADALRVARVPLTGAMEDTQTRSQGKMLR